MSPSTPMKIAVVGSGIAGLSAAYALSAHAQVTVMDAGDYLGGHTHTVDVPLTGAQTGQFQAVDTGFLVFNERTYPQLIKLFADLGVETAKSDMSFSVQDPLRQWEWSGRDLDTVFAQRRNLLRPSFWGMLNDILKFNRICTQLATDNDQSDLDQPLSEFLNTHQWGRPFIESYLLPMLACIWSCPTDQMLAFPVATMIRFCHNHGLIQVNNRPQWHTVKGGARHYVEKIRAHVLRQPFASGFHLNCPVTRVRRQDDGVWVDSGRGTERFDHVVLATHSDQSLSLLAEPSAREQAVLGAIPYQDNVAVLHRDTSVLPQRRKAWAAWNYERAAEAQEKQRVCLHYLLNLLQPLNTTDSLIVSLNPVKKIDPARVIGQYAYAHPVFDRAAIAAQKQLPSLQGQGGVWFCGAWAGYGFHEDGLKSGLDVAQQIQKLSP